MSARRAVISLTAYNAFRGLTVGGFMALLPMYMSYLGYSMSSIGGIITIASLLLALILPAMGYFIDLHGPKTWIIITGILIIAAPLMASTSTTLLGLGLAYGLFLLSFLAGQPARMTFIADNVDIDSMGGAVGTIMSTFSASRTIGPLIAGIIASLYGFVSAFHVLAFSSVIGLLLFIFLSRKDSPRKRKPRGSLKDSYLRFFSPPRGFRVALCLIALDRLSWTLWYPMLSAHLYSHGYSEIEVGAMFSTTGAIQTILSPIAGSLTDRLGAYLILAFSESLGVIAAILLIFPTSAAAVWTSMVAIGGSIALWIPAYNALIAKVGGGTGEAFASANAVRGLAGAPGPYIGGLIYDIIGPAIPFAISSILLVLTSLIAMTGIKSAEKAVSKMHKFPQTNDMPHKFETS
ncbi:MAG: MFS transporter [Candidatus Baldrarchaeia archaeon]